MPALTVTAACSSARIGLAVRVLVNAAASQPGAVVPFPTAADAPVTPQATGSLVYGVMYCSGRSVGSPVDAFSAATVIINDTQAASSHECVTFMSASLTTAGVPVTLGLNPGEGESNPSVLLVEILAAGSLAEDASTPAPVAGPAPFNTAMALGNSLSTAAFTPPPGSLLVALAGASTISGISISDTSGLTWTQQGSAQSSFQVRIWTARVPGSASYVPGPVSRYVVDSPSAVPWPKIPAGTLAAPVTFDPGTGAQAGYGNAATAAGQGAGVFPQLIQPGMVLYLDPTGPVYAAIAAVVSLRPYVQGADDVGHAGLSN